jgi:thymidylate synthase ThyX
MPINQTQEELMKQVELGCGRVYGFFHSVLAMRSAMASYLKTDTPLNADRFGKQDAKLMRKLIKAGPEHRKCIRHIIAQFSVRAPRFVWQEFDTYRIGIEKNSESTMHTILKEPITQEDFWDNIDPDYLNTLNKLRETGDIELLKNALPEGYIQRRFITTNYETLRRIIQQRHNHRLTWWKVFCRKLLEELPESWILSHGLKIRYALPEGGAK